MPYCLVPGCRPMGRHVSYHSLPRDESLAKFWLEVCGRLDLRNSKSAKHAKICSAHFIKADYKNHLQYTLMTEGNSSARPRLKEDAVPTLVTQGWKRMRTGPREIRPAVKRDPGKEQDRHKYVSEALHEYETGQLSGDPVQTIRSHLKMRRARRPRLQVLQVDCETESQILIGDTRSLTPAPLLGTSRGSASVPVFTSRGISEQLAAESGDELDAEALHILQDSHTSAGVARGSYKTAQASAVPHRLTQNSVESPSIPAVAEAAQLPSEMPDRFRGVLGRQRKICSLQLTLRRQTEQLQALQARYELNLEELGVSSDSVGQLFRPVDAALAKTSAHAGGDMLLTPTTLEEATAELHKLRTEVLELRMGLLESAVAANERALTANSQRASLLTVFTPRQTDILVGRRARSDTWDVEDLRRAVALRRVLTRPQYEHLRLHLRLPLPALRQSAAAAQTEPEKRDLYRRLLDQWRSDAYRASSPTERAGDGGATAPLRRPGELLVLRGTAAAGEVRLGRSGGPEARTEEQHTEQTKRAEQCTGYDHHKGEQMRTTDELSETEEMYEMNQVDELVEGDVIEEDAELIEEEAEVDPMQLANLLLNQTVTGEVEVGWEESPPVSVPRSRPMKVAITPSHRPTHQRLEPRETIVWDDLM